MTSRPSALAPSTSGRKAAFISGASTDRLSPLKLSRVSTDPARDVAFYKTIGCEETEHARSADGKHAMRSITWEPPEDVELQFWWHADDQTKGDFTVGDFERGVRAVHKACVSSYRCGFDQWMDHHYAYDGVAVLDHYVEIFDRRNVTYSLWQQAFTDGPVTLYTLYFADETGLAVQLDGTLTTPWDAKGSWGLIRSASEGEEDGIAKCTNCLFADFANANHNLRFDLDADPPTFVAIRVGDLARVDGKKKGPA